MELRDQLSAALNDLWEDAVKSPKHVKAGLSKKMPELANEIRNGEFDNSKKFIDDLLKMLNVEEEVGSFGNITVRINTKWTLALGPKNKNKYTNIITKIIRFKRDLGRPGIYTNDVKFYDEYQERRRNILADTMQYELFGDVNWIEKIMRQDSSDEFKRGNWSVVAMTGITHKAFGECLDALDKASEIVSKKFSQLIYGKVYITSSIHGSRGTIAAYSDATDEMTLSIKAKESAGDVFSIIHELGHRFIRRFWKDRDAQEKFMRLTAEHRKIKVPVTVEDRERMLGEFLKMVDDVRNNVKAKTSVDLNRWSSWLLANKKNIQFLLRKYALEKDDSVLDEIKSTFISEEDGTVELDVSAQEDFWVSGYAKQKRSWQENFCDAFAMYMLGEKLLPEMTEIMDGLSIKSESIDRLVFALNEVAS